MKWVSVWGNAASITERRPEAYAKNISLRYPIRSALRGGKIRLLLSNFCGGEAVTLEKVTIACALNDRKIDVNSARAVTFSGGERVTIAAGEEVFSDEISFTVDKNQEISVTIYLKGYTDMRTGVVAHGPLSKGFYSEGDCTLSENLPLEKTRTLNTFYFLSGVDVLTSDNCRSVILYGDSITAGSWADYLAQMFMDNPDNDTAVVRRAASGTRVLREYDCLTYQSYGLNGRHRFKREISTVSGADSVIIQQGINDIIHPVGTDVNPFRPMSDLPTVEELENGIRYYINAAKDHDLKVYMGTLLPIYGWRTYADFREEMKNDFNGWLRSIGDIEGCIDFDKALRSQKDKRAFAEGYDSGDHLHPSESAYRAMAKLAYDELKRK